jgi:hypothetical protein
MTARAMLVVVAVLTGCGGSAAKDTQAAAGETAAGGVGSDGGADGGQDGGSDGGTVDADGDGHDAAADCDDTDPAVHPGAAEVCNARDDDCDGTVDGGDGLCGRGEVCTTGVCRCAEGFVDCDGDDSNGCETALEDRPAEAIEHGCCHPYDSAGNRLTDCDGDGHCECYGACLDEECVGE